MKALKLVLITFIFLSTINSMSARGGGHFGGGDFHGGRAGYGYHRSGFGRPGVWGGYGLVPGVVAGTAIGTAIADNDSYPYYEEEVY